MTRPSHVKGNWSDGDWAGHEMDFRETLPFLDDPEDDIHSILCDQAEQYGHKQDLYKAYLLTDYWSKVRRQKIQAAKHKCESCGCEDRLEVHHKKYPARYTEASNLHMLKVLCARCHRLEHH